MFSKSHVSIAAFALFFAAATIFLAGRPRLTATAATVTTPAYDMTGNLLPPANYREWVYLSSGIDMSYTANSTGTSGQSKFDNVFVDPAAYRSFQQTGTWPDKTTMVLEVREAKSRGSINLSGHYQGTAIAGFEVHVKNEARFPGKWAFFRFDSPGSNGKLIPQTADCYSCHLAHGAVDTTFVQFYPTLLPIAQKRGTLSQAFQNEIADPEGVR